MIHIIDISMDDDYVRVTSTGEAEFNKHNQAVMDASRLAEENGCNTFLFDIRRTVFREYHITGIKHAEMARDLGVKPEYKIALLGKQEQSAMLEYYETVALNRGVLVKAFTDESEAISWLKNKL